MNLNKQISLLTLTAVLLSACGSQVSLPPLLSGSPSAQPALPVSAPASSASADNSNTADASADTSLDAAKLPKALSLSVGESVQVPVTMSGQLPAAGILSWQSSDPRIAAVTESGWLSAYQPGAVQVIIVQTGHPERRYVLEVTVQSPQTSTPAPATPIPTALTPVSPTTPVTPTTPAPVPTPPAPAPTAPAPIPAPASPAPAPTPAPAPAPTPASAPALPPASAPTPALPTPTLAPIATLPAPTPVPPLPAAVAPSSGFASEVLRLVNVARAAGGNCGGVAYPPAAALSWNTLLGNSAQAHASDMAAKNYFEHTSPDGRTFDQRISAAGYQWRGVAENIAAGQKTPAEVVTGWLGSPGHCKNIFNPALKELGVGYFEGGTYGWYWVQDFGTPR